MHIVGLIIFHILLQYTERYPAAFQIKYGRFVGVTKETPSGYQLTPAWQAGVSQASGIGSFFGTLLNGYLVAKYGQRRVVMGALVAITCFIFLQFFAPNLIVLTVAQILIGFPWGALVCFTRCSSCLRCLYKCQRHEN